jgi:hypothetical protein
VTYATPIIFPSGFSNATPCYLDLRSLAALPSIRTSAQLHTCTSHSAQAHRRIPSHLHIFACTSAHPHRCTGHFPSRFSATRTSSQAHTFIPAHPHICTGATPLPHTCTTMRLCRRTRA